MNILTYFLYNIEVLVRYSKCCVQAFSYHECIKVNPLDGCTFSPHGIIKGRHLVKSLNIRMAQISMKIVISAFSIQLQPDYQFVPLSSWNSEPYSLLSYQYSDIQWPLNLQVGFFSLKTSIFHSNILIFHFKVLKM